MQVHREMDLGMIQFMIFMTTSIWSVHFAFVKSIYLMLASLATEVSVELEEVS